MERHRELYKENCSVVNPRKQNRIILNENRAQQRKNIYNSSRNIASPTPRKGKPISSSTPVINDKAQIVKHELDGKEDIQPRIVTNFVNGDSSSKINKEYKPVANYTSRIAKVAGSKIDVNKLTRQELFLKRFIEWKENQKRNENLRKQRKLTVSASTIVSHKTSSLSRKSFYTVVPTPPRNNKPASKTSVVIGPSDRKPLFESKFALTTNNKARSAMVTKKLVQPTDVNGHVPLCSKVAPIIHQKKEPQEDLPKINTTNNIKNKKMHDMPKGASSMESNVHIERKAFIKARPLILPPLPRTAGEAATTTIAKSSVHVIHQKKKPQKDLPKTTTTRNIENKKLHDMPKEANTIDTNVHIERKAFVKPRPLVLPLLPATAERATTIPAKSSAPSVKPIGTNGKVDARNGITDIKSSNGLKTTTAGGGAAAKAKATLQQKRFPDEQQKKPVKLSISMKAKKPPSSSVATHKCVSKKLSGKKLLKLTKAVENDIPAIAETPTDVTVMADPFNSFITSTKYKAIKHSSNDLIDVSDEVSPIEVVENANSMGGVHCISSTSAKAATSNKILPTKSKFNFVRYSEACSEIDIGPMELVPESDREENTPAEEQKIESHSSKKIVDLVQPLENNDILNTVQPKQASPPKETVAPCEPSSASLSTPPQTKINADRSANYLSPYVSVSRGKVNMRSEKEKRNSIYLTDETMDAKSIETRRTLDTVSHFRKQLNDEISRLNALCDQWDLYKIENTELLQNTGGDDMINVTVGQTKLLSNKKFMQFRGLIDRCEAGALGNAPHDDGSEGTKLITSVDLEGFWSMLGLQVDNVNKRFENLQRWRANAWLDPDDDVKSKAIKKVSNAKVHKKSKAVAAAKAKPTSGLQQMLRKMHAEMRKNKAVAANGGTGTLSEMTDAILTPSRKSQGPRRSFGSETKSPGSATHRLVIVKDRKSRSAAATRLSIPIAATSPSATLEQHSNHHCSPLRKQQTFISPSLQKDVTVVQQNDLRRTILMSGTEQAIRKSLTTVKAVTPSRSSPVVPAILGRKSILKTPGTATKRNPKNVVFDDKLRIKKFKFRVESDQSDTDEDELEQRTYKLRTRKVVLRRSSEIIIPT